MVTRLHYGEICSAGFAAEAVCVALGFVVMRFGVVRFGAVMSGKLWCVLFCLPT